MEVQDKDLLTSPATCSSTDCTSGSYLACGLPQCKLCRQCLSAALRVAWPERKNQFATTRIFSLAVARGGEAPAGLQGSNRRMAAWYRGKCLMDTSWCDALCALTSRSDQSILALPPSNGIPVYLIPAPLQQPGPF